MVRVIAVTFFLFIVSTSAAMAKDVRANLTAFKKDADLFVEITYSNISDNTVYLISGYTGINSLYWPALQIKDAKGKNAKPVDSSIADRIFSETDFIRLDPKEKIVAKIKLNDYYKIESNNTYYIKYKFNPAVSNKKDINGKTFGLESNRIKIKY
jgi:hypothetical protein